MYSQHNNIKKEKKTIKNINECILKNEEREFETGPFGGMGTSGSSKSEWRERGMVNMMHFTYFSLYRTVTPAEIILTSGGREKRENGGRGGCNQSTFKHIWNVTMRAPSTYNIC
jgi:hypothetical protein